jgi:hypothetical protein
MIKILFTLAVLFFSGHLRVHVDNPPAAVANAPEEAPKDSKKERDWMESLPNRLANFAANGRMINYEDGPNGYGMGYSMGYRTGINGIWTTVYFYHSGMANLENGIESEKFKKLWRESTADDYFSLYRDIAAKEDVEATFQGVPFRLCRFMGFLKNGGIETQAHMFMTVYQGSFLKVRIDYFKEHGDGANDVETFMDALVKELELTRERNEKSRGQEW